MPPQQSKERSIARQRWHPEDNRLPVRTERNYVPIALVDVDQGRHGLVVSEQRDERPFRVVRAHPPQRRDANCNPPREHGKLDHDERRDDEVLMRGTAERPQNQRRQACANGDHRGGDGSHVTIPTQIHDSHHMTVRTYTLSRDQDVRGSRKKSVKKKISANEKLMLLARVFTSS